MNDSEQIKNLTQLYIDSMSHSSAEKVKDAFHSNGTVGRVFYTEILWKCLSMTSLTLLASQQPSPKEKGEEVEYEILAS